MLSLFHRQHSNPLIIYRRIIGLEGILEDSNSLPKAVELIGPQGLHTCHHLFFNTEFSNRKAACIDANSGSFRISSDSQKLTNDKQDFFRHIYLLQNQHWFLIILACLKNTNFCAYICLQDVAFCQVYGKMLPHSRQHYAIILLYLPWLYTELLPSTTINLQNAVHMTFN